MTSKIMVASVVLLLGFFRFLGSAKKADPDQLVLDQLKKVGSDPSKPHNIEFFIYFRTKADAIETAPKIKEAGFEVDVRQAAQGLGWLCLATKTMVPDLSALQKIRRDFGALAAARGGEYDGWGTGVVK
jgi:regulator of RNase E activity RraB